MAGSCVPSGTSHLISQKDCGGFWQTLRLHAKCLISAWFSKITNNKEDFAANNDSAHAMRNTDLIPAVDCTLLPFTYMCPCMLVAALLAYLHGLALLAPAPLFALSSRSVTFCSSPSELLLVHANVDLMPYSRTPQILWNRC